MEREKRSDWCWSNNAVVVFGFLILFGGIFLYNMISPGIPRMEVGPTLAVLILVFGTGIICYCFYDFFEQDKKYKAEQRMKQTRH